MNQKSLSQLVKGDKFSRVGVVWTVLSVEREEAEYSKCYRHTVKEASYKMELTNDRGYHGIQRFPSVGAKLFNIVD